MADAIGKLYNNLKSGILGTQSAKIDKEIDTSLQSIATYSSKSSRNKYVDALKSLVNTAGTDTSVKLLKDEILKLRDKQYNVSIEKTDLLSHSIEDQLVMFVNSYTTYLVLERSEGDKWAKHFDKYEKFLVSENADLISKAYYYINYLIYGDNYESQEPTKTS